MADDHRYAILTHPERYDAKPRVFQELRHLAAHLHQQRKGAPIQLQDSPMAFEGEADARQGVSVWTLTEDGARRCFLGWAWLNGAGRQSLETAIFALQPRPARPLFAGG